MRVLMLTHAVFPEVIGGREKYCYYLSRELSKSGDRVGLVYWQSVGRFGDSNAWDFTVRRYPIREELHRSPTVAGLLYVLRSMHACASLRCEVVISNSMYFPLVSATILSVLFRTPFVHVVHDPQEPEMAMDAGLASAVVRACYRRATRIIAVSQEVMDLILPCVSARSKVTVVPPGVQPRYFELNQKPLSGPEYVIFTSRRLEPSKGIDVLIHAASILSCEGFGISVDIVGDGSAREQLERASKELHVESIVRFHGFLDENSLASLLEQADICVIPSRTEGTPVALLEFMAAARPVVASRVGGISDVLKEQGVLVEPGNPLDLASKLRALFTRPSVLLALGSENRRVAAARYSWTRISLLVKRVLQSCICGSGYE